MRKSDIFLQTHVSLPASTQLSRDNLLIPSSKQTLAMEHGPRLKTYIFRREKLGYSWRQLGNPFTSGSGAICMIWMFP